MHRNSFTIAATVSAGLCAGACVLWMASNLGWGYHEWMVDGRWHIGASAGLGELGLWDVAVFEPRGRTRPIHFDCGVLAFEQKGDKMNRSRDLSIRFWAIAIASIGLPAGWVVVRLRDPIRVARRRAAGFCPSCGYDLRATPDRCPECGTAAAAPAAR